MAVCLAISIIEAYEDKKAENFHSNGGLFSPQTSFCTEAIAILMVTFGGLRLHVEPLQVKCHVLKSSWLFAKVPTDLRKCSGERTRLGVSA